MSRFMRSSGEFETGVLREIYAVIPFDLKTFYLDVERKGEFPLYGDNPGEVAPLACRRNVAFAISGESERGTIAVGVCDQELAQLRELTRKSRSGLERTLAALRQMAVREPTDSELRALGWFYNETRSPDGTELHYFPVFLIGHGVFPVPTAVLFGGQRGIVVQAGTLNLCQDGGTGLRLCTDRKGTLTEIARRIQSRIP